MLNKNILEKEIKEALREAYVKSFTDNVCNQEAVKYVKKAAKYFADALYNILCSTCANQNSEMRLNIRSYKSILNLLSGFSDKSE